MRRTMLVAACVVAGIVGLIGTIRRECLDNTDVGRAEAPQ
jgi:hypothetical protein